MYFLHTAFILYALKLNLNIFFVYTVAIVYFISCTS